VSGDCLDEQVAGPAANNGGLALTDESLADSPPLNITFDSVNNLVTLNESATTGQLTNGGALAQTGVERNSPNSFRPRAGRSGSVDYSPGRIVSLKTDLPSRSTPNGVSQALAAATGSISINGDMAARFGSSITGDIIVLNNVPPNRTRGFTPRVRCQFNLISG
jgi:hypothetical protein